MPRHLALTLALSLGIGACISEPTDETPGGALTLFLRAMERSQWDADARAEAYALLCEEARARLQERASLANSLGGREFEPWEMLPQGRFRAKLTVPSSDHLRTTLDGDQAEITIDGPTPEHHARVPMVREAGGWRVVLNIPPMRRDGSAHGASQSGIELPARADRR